MKGTLVFAGKREMVEVPSGWNTYVWGVGRRKGVVNHKGRPVILLGSAGSLREDFRIGDVLVPEEVTLWRETSEVTPLKVLPLPAGFLDAMRKKGLRLHTGVRLLTVDQPAGVEDKCKLSQVADAVDMETYHVRKSVENVFVVRVISDEVNESPDAWVRNLSFVKAHLSRIVEVLEEVFT